MGSQKTLAPDPAQARRLGQRATSAGFWSILELVAGQVLRLVSNLIMTRLLLPEAFGVMTMVTTLHVGLILFSDIGIGTSIVRSPRGAEPHFLRVTWLVQILRGLLIALCVVLAGALLWAVGPYLAPAGTVYADPTLPFLIMLSALIAVFEGGISTNYWLATRNMQLSRFTATNLISQIGALAFMVGFAQVQATVWALLAGVLMGAVLKMALSHLIIRGPRMAFAWDTGIALEIWHFGKWVLGSSALTFVAQNTDRLILGALMAKASFGFYSIALMWVQAAAMVAQKLTTQVVFPAVSEVQRHRPDQVRAAFARYSLVIDAIVLAGFLVCLFGGTLLIGLLYTDTYQPAAQYMAVLALLVLTARFMPLETLLLTYGDSKTMMKISALKGAAICIGIPLGYSAAGVDGAILAGAVAPLAGAPLVLRKTAPLLGGVRRVDLLWLVAILSAVVPVGVKTGVF